MAERIEIRVPDIGEFTDVPVIEVLVAVGDTVEAEDSLVTLESDKATMEVPSPAAGVIVELAVSLDDTVSEGDLVAVMETAGEASGDAAEDSEEQPEEQSSAEPAEAAAATQNVEVRVPDIGEFTDVPVIEVHLSNIFRREDYRHHSYVSKAAVGVICGLGAEGYALAIEAMAGILNAKTNQAAFEKL